MSEARYIVVKPQNSDFNPGSQEPLTRRILHSFRGSKFLETERLTVFRDKWFLVTNF